MRGILQPADEPTFALPFYRWMGAACLIFGLIVIVNPQDPEMDWGSRYLLTMLPLLLLLAARALEGNYFRVEGPMRLAVVLSGVGLAGVGIYAEVRGLATIRERMTNMGKWATLARTLPAPVLVVDLCHYGAHFVDDPPPGLFLVRDPQTEGERFFSLLDRRGIHEFIYVGMPDGLAPMQAAALRHDFVPVGLVPPDRPLGVRFVRQSRPSP